jgi:hypothetical protein
MLIYAFKKLSCFVINKTDLLNGICAFIYHERPKKSSRIYLVCA